MNSLPTVILNTASYSVEVNRLVSKGLRTRNIGEIMREGDLLLRNKAATTHVVEAIQWYANLVFTPEIRDYHEASVWTTEPSGA